MKIKLLLSFLLIHTFLIVNATTPLNATIAYNSPICASSGVAIVIFSGNTGGIFSASPSGLAIDATTGSINPNQSLVGTYVVTYTILPGIDPMFETSTTVTINNNILPQFAQIAPICVNSQAPVLPTTSMDGISGTWTPSVINNQISSTYTFTPNAGECATTTSLIVFVSPTPYATITGNTTICQGTSTAVTITGTPNSTVTYSYNSSFNQTITLDSNGTATLTPTLSASTAVCLISVESWSVGSCITPLTGCCVITVVPNVIIAPIADVTYCTEYILPALPVGNYFTQPGGLGTMLNAGDVITSTQTIYVYAATATTPSCVSEDSFQVTVIPAVSPTIATADNINYIIVDGAEIVQTLQLNTGVQSGNYGYQWMESGNDIIGAMNPTYTVNTVFGNSHYYSVRVTNLIMNCVTVSPIFQVFEIPVPTPVGDPNQTFTLGQTLADVVVFGQNIQWYDALNRNTTSNPLPLSTVLVEGVTYYATQTINGHESDDRWAVTVQFTLATNQFNFNDLTYSPNPVAHVLNIKSSEIFKSVKVYNNVGQEVYQQNITTFDLQLDLGFLKTGNYFITLESDKKHQVIQVIKR